MVLAAQTSPRPQSGLRDSLLRIQDHQAFSQVGRCAAAVHTSAHHPADCSFSEVARCAAAKSSKLHADYCTFGLICSFTISSFSPKLYLESIYAKSILLAGNWRVTMDSKKRITLKVNATYAPILFIFYGSSATLMGYLTVILQSKHFSDFQIGLAVSLGSIASILFQPLVGMFSDKNPHVPLKRIIICFSGILIAFALGLMFLTSPIFLVMLMSVFASVTFMSMMSMLDSLALQFENRGISVNHGLARGLGSLGFAVFGYLMGITVNRYGVETIIPAFCVLLTLAMIMITFLKRPDKVLPQSPGESIHPKSRTTIRQLLHKNLGLLCYALAIGFITTNRSILDTFQVRIIQELGGTTADYGLAMLIMATCELPTMFMFKFLSRKIGFSKMISGGFIFFAVKDVALFFAPSVSAVIVLQVLNLLTVGLYNSAAIYRTNEIVGPQSVVTGQALVTGVACGSCSLLGITAAGAIMDAVNYQAMLVFAVVVAAAGFMLLQVSSLLLKKRAAENDPGPALIK